MGGMVKAVERGFPQAEIANSAYHFQRQLETKEKVMVGVNKYQAEEKARRSTLSTSTARSRRSRSQKLAELRRKRNAAGLHASAPSGERSRARPARTSWTRSSAP